WPVALSTPQAGSAAANSNPPPGSATRSITVLFATGTSLYCDQAFTGQRRTRRFPPPAHPPPATRKRPSALQATEVRDPLSTPTVLGRATSVKVLASSTCTTVLSRKPTAIRRPSGENRAAKGRWPPPGWARVGCPNVPSFTAYRRT